MPLRKESIGVFMDSKIKLHVIDHDSLIQRGEQEMVTPFEGINRHYQEPMVTTGIAKIESGGQIPSFSVSAEKLSL